MSLFSKKETLILKIEGMHCAKCAARAENALNAVSGVKAKVDLATATATVTLSKPVELAVLKQAVEDEGYTVVD